jgi:hypothetical protein
MKSSVVLDPSDKLRPNTFTSLSIQAPQTRLLHEEVGKEQLGFHITAEWRIVEHRGAENHNQMKVVVP